MKRRSFALGGASIGDPKNDPQRAEDDTESRSLVQCNHDIPLPPSSDDSSVEHDASELQSPVVSFSSSVLRITILYLTLLAVLILGCSGAEKVVLIFRMITGLVCLAILHDTMSTICLPAIKERRFPQPPSLLRVFCFVLSFWSCQSYAATNLYATAFFFVKPCHKFEDFLKQLQDHSAEHPVEGVDHYWATNPFQAVGLNNAHMKRFQNALHVHFDRYGRNETDRFKLVETMNLMANAFDDRGAEDLISALEHPHAYTKRLLLGRNTFLGDNTATRLAQLIRIKKPSSSSSFLLDWLSLGGTSITAKGLDELYAAMGTRSFSYLGLDYHRRGNSYLSFLFSRNAVSDSLQYLHKAKLLTEIGLTGNWLGDKDMFTVAVNVQETNMTKLGLTNNLIGPRGVENLVPLTLQLTELGLGINRWIGDEGAALLADALRDPNCTLATLSLFNCWVGMKGAEALLSVFPNNTRLKHLSLEVVDPFVSQEDETHAALQQAVRKNWDG